MGKTTTAMKASFQLRLTNFFGGNSGNDQLGVVRTDKRPAVKKGDDKQLAKNKDSSLCGRKRRIDGSSFGCCPICQTSVALYRLERHASTCNGGKVGSSAAIQPVLTPPALPSVPIPYSEPLPGLFIFENVVSKEEEASLLRLLDFDDVVKWKTSCFNGSSYGKRWGVHCNLRDRRVDPPQYPLPGKIQDFIRLKLSKLKDSLPTHLADFHPNEANAIDYRRREGHWLKAHVDDRQLSKEPIANLSLAGECIMTFRNQKLTSSSVPNQAEPAECRVLLRRGTLQLLTGKARYNYSHEISNGDLLNDRRVSITMRESPLTASSTPTAFAAPTSATKMALPHYAWRSYRPYGKKAKTEGGIIKE